MHAVLIVSSVLFWYFFQLGAAQSLSTGQKTCTIFDGREVRCWGFLDVGRVIIGDDFGEMGINIPIVDVGSVSVPQSVYTSVSATCVLFANQRIKCWGIQTALGNEHSRFTEFDDPTEMGDNLAFVNLGTGVKVKEMCLTVDFACALTIEGRVKCWGSNFNGQLGLGDTTARSENVGDMGDNLPYVDLGNDLRATQISCNGLHTCVVLESGDLKCWGQNTHGQLGLGDTEHRGDEPGEMGTNLPLINLGSGLIVRQVSTGNSHTCVLLTNNRIKCWGLNSAGQLGYEDTVDRGTSPTQMGENLQTVEYGGGIIIEISLGKFMTCALLTGAAGTKCWGRNIHGSLGQGNTDNAGDAVGTMGSALNPIDLGTSLDVLNIYPGTANACVRFADNSLKCWGSNFNGDLGLGDSENRGDDPGEMGSSLPFVDLGPGRSIFDGATLAPSPEPTAGPTVFTVAPTDPTSEPTTAAPTEAPDRTDIYIGIAVGVVVFLGFICLGCSYCDNRVQAQVYPNQASLNY